MPEYTLHPSVWVTHAQRAVIAPPSLKFMHLNTRWMAPTPPIFIANNFGSNQSGAFKQSQTGPTELTQCLWLSPALGHCLRSSVLHSHHGGAHKLQGKEHRSQGRGTSKWFPVWAEETTGWGS